MDRDEILAKARQENNNQDMCEKDAIVRASSIAIKVGMTLCCLMVILEVIFTGRINFSSWAIYFGMLGTTCLVKFLMLRVKHELVVAILYLGLSVWFLVLYIIALVG